MRIRPEKASGKEDSMCNMSFSGADFSRDEKQRGSQGGSLHRESCAEPRCKLGDNSTPIRSVKRNRVKENEIACGV